LFICSYMVFYCFRYIRFTILSRWVISLKNQFKVSMV
jgi:hypothetical protein